LNPTDEVRKRKALLLQTSVDRTAIHPHVLRNRLRITRIRAYQRHDEVANLRAEIPRPALGMGFQQPASEARNSRVGIGV
jgi:hypothetical protein